jgi:SAM-dependent methyltransferase
MSYHGYVPLIKKFLYQLPQEYAPSVLEIGIDTGATLVPLTAFLARTRPEFCVFGVDIKVQEAVKIMLSNLDLQPTQHVYFFEENSLSLLPKMAEECMKFDVVLIDGDHNYHTVSEEMKHVEAITHQNSIVICDDYEGRWSERDLFYADRADYVDVKLATKKVETEKHGVKPAIDEWLESHQEWQKAQPIKGEPILLTRKAI